MNRRQFLMTGVAGVLAPAYIKADVLMPVKKIIVPERKVVIPYLYNIATKDIFTAINIWGRELSYIRLVTMGEIGLPPVGTSSISGATNQALRRSAEKFVSDFTNSGRAHELSLPGTSAVHSPIGLPYDIKWIVL